MGSPMWSHDGMIAVGNANKNTVKLTFVGVADGDHSVARPHWASHPLPFLDDLPVGLKDGVADAGERFAAPVCEFCDQLVNTFRWIHWILCLQFRSLRKKPSKEMAFPHPKPRKDKYGNEHKPSRGRVVWNLFKRTINITDYWNGQDEVNPANNRTFSGLFHD